MDQNMGKVPARCGKSQRNEPKTQVIMTHPFQKFLHQFTQIFEKKFIQHNRALWILETTGSEDAAELKSELDAELRILLSDPKTFRQLVDWEKEIDDPLLKRELNVLVRSFKPNQIPKEMLEKIAEKEAKLSQSYAHFRPILHGKKVSENEIRSILKKEDRVEERKKAWEASKEIGEVLAPQILELVALRNESAKSLGYSDYFQMNLELQEVDSAWLKKTFDVFSKQSEKAYADTLHEIEKRLAKRFQVPPSELGPWAWSEPFCQEDPLDNQALDSLLDDVDIIESASTYYDGMGVDVRPILAKSDMFERVGKSQHAFCIHIDRKGDVRTLNNVQKSIKWLETVLHEYGHAIYDAAIDPKLPFFLKEPPHMITTEAMALLAGRQAYRTDALIQLVGNSGAKKPIMKMAEESVKRRQLIFSRWVLVMTDFESEMYKNPAQDLNALWWSLVEKYQKIKRPAGREKKWDWAAKYHIGLAPVYYFSYLLGEMFASSIQKALERECKTAKLASKEAGKFLTEKLFRPGGRMHWNELIKHVTGSYLTPDAWLLEFGT